MTGSLQHQKHAYSQLCGLFFFGQSPLDVSPNHLWSLCPVKPSVLAQRSLRVKEGKQGARCIGCDRNTQLGIKLSWEHLFSAFSLRIKRVSKLRVHFSSAPPKTSCVLLSTGALAPLLDVLQVDVAVRGYQSPFVMLGCLLRDDLQDEVRVGGNVSGETARADVSMVIFIKTRLMSFGA